MTPDKRDLIITIVCAIAITAVAVYLTVSFPKKEPVTAQTPEQKADSKKALSEFVYPTQKVKK